MATSPKFALVFTFSAVQDLMSIDELGSVMTPSGQLLPAVRMTRRSESGPVESYLPLLTRSAATPQAIEDLRVEIKERLDALLDTMKLALGSDDEP